MIIGQWYRNAAGVRIEVLGVDWVGIDTKDGEVVAYRYEGRETIHMRATELTSDWVREGAIEPGTVVRCRTVIEGIRVGSKGRYVVEYASDHTVVVTTLKASGVFFSETAMTRADFDRRYEIDPG